jgi:D-alanine-D-alanine ligase
MASKKSSIITKKKPIKRSKTLGPVADLEKHLPSDWWANLFTSLYLKTDADVVENHYNTQKEVDTLIEATQVTPNQSILDLCCGQGRHSIELYSRGYENVSGMDRSRYLIRLAKNRATKLGYHIKFSEGDARKIRLPESSLDCVVLFGNSFGYFESQEDDIAVLNSIIKALKTNGKLAMDIVNGAWMREHFEPRSWEWIDENQFTCRERSLSEDKSRIISREVIVHAERGVIADQFYAERIYNFDEISDVLEQLNFANITLHTSLNANSTRAQDLGMMANRMFITAIGPVKKIRKHIITPKKHILVIMGDPSLPDTVKLNSQYNDEDFATIDKLKTALQSLTAYNFSFFNNHKKLIEHLRQTKPEFVFNLCDEGYNNEATKELHVPALLELFNIPYSGAAPACLAMCYNKAVVRSIAAAAEIPVPLETYYDSNDQAATLPSIFPALLKPNFGDNSIGITKDAVVNNSEELVSYLEQLKSTIKSPILIQEFLPGKEYSVAIIGNPGNYTILPILEVDYSNLPNGLPQILGYESKWMPDSPYWTSIKYLEANLNNNLERKLIDHSIILFERLGCRDYARFDFRTDQEDVVKLLEVNPNPGWCWDGKLNIMARFAGKSYPELLSLIIEAAQERLHENKVVEYANVAIHQE